MDGYYALILSQTTIRQSPDRAEQEVDGWRPRRSRSSRIQFRGFPFVVHGAMHIVNVFISLLFICYYCGPCVYRFQGNKQQYLLVLHVLQKRSRERYRKVITKVAKGCLVGDEEERRRRNRLN